MDVHDLLQICRCPCCGSDLESTELRTETSCSQGHIFPLFNKRVPVLLVDSEKHNAGSSLFTNVATGEKFSVQWQIYKEGDNIWGLTELEWKKSILARLDIQEEDLKGKLVLDLGCGHGIHSALLAKMGARVVGIDITDGFYPREKSLDSSLRERLNFVRGDIFNFPLKDGLFDYVWCSGVLHHTPDTEKAFQKVSNVVKKGGKFCLFVYRKNAKQYRINTFFRKITVHLPETLLLMLCYVGAPIFTLIKYILNKTNRGFRVYEKRSLRENALSLHDTLSPPYAWHHDEEEVLDWFTDNDFEKAIICDYDPIGIYAYAYKI
jgi:ubiquinone/menaquinone biosynthesis C-methylase UbiE